MSAAKLVIFDYSGTLSLEAPRFGASGNLTKTLKETGLVKLGVTTPEIFWEDIVIPSWDEGSTTAVGYKTIFEKRIRKIFPENSAVLSDAEIARSVSDFVDRYFDHSMIDKRWRPALVCLKEAPSVRAIIATDHYREATAAIVRSLGEITISSISAVEGYLAARKGSFIVANSAEIGFHKADRKFWDVLKSGVPLTAIQRILLIDDFGSNENVRSAFGTREKVIARQKKTTLLLEEIFDAEVTVIPFVVERRRGKESIGRQIREISCAIKEFIASDERGSTNG